MYTFEIKYEDSLNWQIRGQSSRLLDLEEQFRMHVINSSELPCRICKRGPLPDLLLREVVAFFGGR